MQTFLPYPNFKESCKVLDYKRLGKQRVEAYSILNILHFNKQSRWYSHPAVQMWKGYENALAHYYNCCIIEWMIRGYMNNLPIWTVNKPIIYPWWFGDERFHLSHQSNLLRKSPIYYSQFKWDIDPNLTYFWPKRK